MALHVQSQLRPQAARRQLERDRESGRQDGASDLIARSSRGVFAYSHSFVPATLTTHTWSKFYTTLTQLYARSPKII